MYISKVKIKNFKCYKKFEIELNPELNIIVGDNESGKSTLLEAINLALTGYILGKNIKNELSQYMFNLETVKEYIDSFHTTPIAPPEISIEIFFGESNFKSFNGDYNSDNSSDAEGILFQIKFDDEYIAEYESYINNSDVKSVPIEYYEVRWTSFARESITTKSIPFNSILIDSSDYKYKNGEDAYLSRIIKNKLSTDEIVNISQATRKLKEDFSDDKSMKLINEKLQGQTPLLKDKKLEITVDFGTKNEWKSLLMVNLDDVPFNYIGKGAQSVVKTNLSLSNENNTEKPSVILLEEPENHLSHSNLNILLGYILEENSMTNQLLITTHSSFVANKLGLEKIILLKNQRLIKFKDLQKDTYDYFRKIAGYDTLRFILCKKAILCEGDSDELVIQKSYMLLNQGKLPIQNGIEVISVGTSFLRFLEIVSQIDVKVCVVTDNDGDLQALENKYSQYLNKEPNIKICYSKNVKKGSIPSFNYNTLEPELYYANGLEKTSKILNKQFENEENLLEYMHNNKTECALKFFDYKDDFEIPEYIKEAICDE